jgi:hypothetical protein
MVTKRKSTLKQVFNAWLKYNKKSDEAYKAKRYVSDLANQCEPCSTELIEHEGKVYRVTIDKNRWDNNYEIKEIAKASELPVKN